MDGSSHRGCRGSTLSLLFGAFALVAVVAALAPLAAAQSADIQAPGVNIKAEESGKAEIEALGVSIKVTPPEVRELPEGEAIDLSGAWKFKGDWQESGLSEKWYQPEFDDSDWRTLHVPASWESQGINTNNPRWPVRTDNCGYNGFAWYRRHFTVPESWTEARVVLRIGSIWDEDWTYVNGQAIGQSTGPDVWDQRRQYLIPPDVLRPGEDNVIAIRVFDSVHEGGIAEGPVELLSISEEAAAAAAETREYTRTRGDLVRFGSSITIDADEKIRGDVVAFGGNVDVAGYIEGDLAAIGGSVHLLDGARVDGDITTVGGRIDQDPGAIIGGEMVEVGSGITLPGSWFGKEHGKGWRDHPRWAFPTAGLLGGIVLWAFLVLLAALLFRDRLETMATVLPVYPGRAVLYGLAGIVLTPAALLAVVLVGVFVTVLLVITLVGILLIPAVWAGVAALCLVPLLLLLAGVIAVWLAIGKALATALKKPDLHPIWAALIGLVVVAVAARLPVVGGLVVFTLIIFGFGLAVMTGFGADPEWAHKRLGLRRRPPAPPEPPPASETPPAHEIQPVEEATPTDDEASPEMEAEGPAADEPPDAVGGTDEQPQSESDELKGSPEEAGGEGPAREPES